MKSGMIKKMLLGLPVFSVCCFVLRLYQLREELLADGSLVEGAVMHRVLFLVPICVAICLALAVYPLKPLQKHKECFSAHPLPNGLLLASGIGLLAGNLLLLTGDQIPVSQYSAVSNVLSELLPYSGFLAGLCMLAFGFLSMKERKPSPLLYMAVSLYLVVRLIVYFQAWNTDPSIHDYAFQLLAAICTMLGSYQIAGFGFDKGKRRMSIFWCLMAVFFCSVTAADLLEDPAQMLVNLSLLLSLLVHGLQLLLAPDPVEEPEEPEAAEEAPEEEPAE